MTRNVTDTLDTVLKQVVAIALLVVSPSLIAQVSEGNVGFTGYTNDSIDPVAAGLKFNNFRVVASSATDIFVTPESTAGTADATLTSIASVDGSEFKLTQFDYIHMGFGLLTVTVTAYRDSVNVGDKTFTWDFSTEWDAVAESELGAAFNNIDELRISTTPNIGFTGLIGLDNFVLDAVPNSAPVLGGGTHVFDGTVWEDTRTLVYLSAYHVSDADGDSITLTLAVDRGTIASTDGNGTTAGVTVANSGTGSMTLQGTAANLNTYLDDSSKIFFTTASNDTDPVTLTVTPNDGTVNGTADTVTLNVNAVNDNPQIASLPTDVTIAEDTRSNIDLSGATLTDPDSSSLTLTLTASAGSFATPADGAAVGSGVTETLVNAATITLLGAAADIDSYLNTASNLQYTAAFNINGGDLATITVIANDGDGSGDVPLGTVNVDVTAVNDLPVFSGLDGTPSFTEGGMAVLLDSDVTVSDVELDVLGRGSSDYAGASLVILRYGGANAWDNYSIQSGGNLSVAGSNISAGGNVIATFDTSSPGQLTVIFQNNGSIPTTALVNEVLQAIRYSNSSDDPAAEVKLEWSFSDGNSANVQGGGANPGIGIGSTTVSITNINDAPTLSATGRNPTYIEGAAGADLFGTVAVSAVESGQVISSLTLTVTNVSDGASEILRFDGSDVALTHGTNVTTAINTLTVSVTGAGTTATVRVSGATLSAAQSQTLLDGVSYRHLGDNPSTAGNRVVTITALVDSGGTTGGGVNTAAPNLTSTVSLVSVNDPPLIGNLDGDSIVVLTGSRGKVDTGSDSIVSNADSADYDGGFLSIVDNGDNNTANGNFSVDGTNVTSGSDGSLSAGETISVGGVNIGTVHATEDGQGSNDLRINLNANSSNERVQALLRNLSWGAAAGNGAQTFSVTLDDADGTANSGDEDATANFTMTLGNAPRLGGAPADVSIDEDAPTAIDLSAFTITDLDNDEVTLTLTVSAGSVAFGSVIGTGGERGVIVENSSSASMTLKGTEEVLNEFLNDATNVVYSPLANSNTAATLTVTPNDGLIDGTAYAVTIDINPVDDPPENTVPGGQTGVDGTAKAVTGASIADIDSTSLTTLVTAAHGAAAVSEAGGATVTGNNGASVSITGSVAQINAALAGLSYTPDVNSSGAQTLQLATNDGTTTDTDSIAITVADRPTIDNFTGTVTFNKGSSGELLDAGSDALVSDADSANFNGGHLTLSITAGAVPAEDLLTVDTSGNISLAVNNVAVSGTVVGTLGKPIAAGNDLVVNLNANATPARLSILVQALQYQNLDSANATSGSRSITLKISDGVNEGSASMTLTIPAPASSDPDEGRVISSNIENTGTLTNVTILKKASVSGGTLAGTIVNHGLVRDVRLSAGAIISGGMVAGQITGNRAKPALVNSLIVSGSRLENIVLGPEAVLEPGVVFGRNICVSNVDMIPEFTNLSQSLNAVEKQYTANGNADDGTIRLLDLNMTPFGEVCDYTGPNILNEVASLNVFLEESTSVAQSRESGELRIGSNGFEATLLPVYFGRAESEELTGVSITADGDISIVLDRGMQIVSYPALVDMEALLNAAPGLEIIIDDRAVMHLRLAHLPEAFVARPSVIAVPENCGEVQGVYTYNLKELANVTGVCLTFEDSNGQLVGQELYPMPADWIAVKATLQSITGATNVRIGTDGIISVDAGNRTIRAMTDYWLHDEDQGSGNTEFRQAGDLNSDGIGDFEIIYPDGKSQWLYILP